jgi:uncharacterized protein
MLKFLLLMSVLLSSSATADVKTVEEKWPDGSIKLRQQMAQDLLGRMLANGLETRYLPGGKKQTETTYRFGVLDGPWREYYLSGVLKREGRYKHGDKDGPETLYDEKGLKASQINYKEGQREGKSFEWQGNNKVFEGQYEKDRLTGTVQEWYANGTPKSVRHYNKSGALDGQEQTWYPNGQDYIEANYADGLKNGEYQEWFANGKLKYHAFYKQGSPDGKFDEWFADGAPKSSGQYVNGQMDGTWKDWRELTDQELRQFAKEHPASERQKDDSKTATSGGADSKDTDVDLKIGAAGKAGSKGRVTDVGDFSKGDLTKDASGDAKAKDSDNGNKQAGDTEEDSIPRHEHPLSGERNFKHGIPQGKQITYHDNGQKQLEVMVDTGKRDGPYTEWYPNGQVRSIGRYFQDQLHGEIKYWFDDGKPWAVNNYFKGTPVGHWIEWDEQGNVVR